VVSLTVRRYRCYFCGHIYDEDAGDPEAGIAPGTRFEDLPLDWVCPSCGADRDQFHEETD
jgi:rubredoxin